MGSSLKFCLVAEGVADVYPRSGPTMEWDTAAAHCILDLAGGSVTAADGTRLFYNKPSLLNPGIPGRWRTRLIATTAYLHRAPCPPDALPGPCCTGRICIRRAGPSAPIRFSESSNESSPRRLAIFLGLLLQPAWAQQGPSPKAATPPSEGELLT